MKVRVRRDYYGEEGQTRAGQLLEISEPRFRQLTEGIHKSSPLVDPVEIGYKMLEPPQNKMMPAPKKNKKMEQTRDPTFTPQPGGQTGEPSDVSLSDQDQQPTRSTSRNGRRRRKSSLSTTPGN